MSMMELSTEEKIKVIHYWVEYFDVERLLIGNNIMMRVAFGPANKENASHILLPGLTIEMI